MGVSRVAQPPSFLPFIPPPPPPPPLPSLSHDPHHHRLLPLYRRRTWICPSRWRQATRAAECTIRGPRAAMVRAGPPYCQLLLSPPRILPRHHIASSQTLVAVLESCETAGDGLATAFVLFLHFSHFSLARRIYSCSRDVSMRLVASIRARGC